MWLCPSDNIHRVLEIIKAHIYHDTARETFRVLPLRYKLGKILVLAHKSPRLFNNDSSRKTFWLHDHEYLEVAHPTGAKILRAPSRKHTKNLWETLDLNQSSTRRKW